MRFEKTPINTDFLGAFSDLGYPNIHKNAINFPKKFSYLTLPMLLFVNLHKICINESDDISGGVIA